MQLLKAHSEYFDRLVNLVPAKVYLNIDADRTAVKFLRRAERDAAKATFKQQYKIAKQAKLDPDGAKTTVQIQNDGKGVQTDPEIAFEAPESVSCPAGPREELQKRLQKKLQTFRTNRKAEERKAAKERAKNWRDKAFDSGRKAAKQKVEAVTPSLKQELRLPMQAQNEQTNKDSSLKFTRLDFGDSRRKKRKQSKEALLAAAEVRQAAAGELIATPEGRAQLQKDAWNAALARAQGEKVKDDPKLLRKSLKSESKMKAKKTAAWKERLKSQHEAQATKQQKRRDNIGARVKAKVEKKKVRREKKLLRAGFEGRKQGFIASPSQ